MSKITLEAEIKSNIGKVNQETAQMINNFGAFGITVGVVKDKIKEMAKIAINGLKAINLQAKLATLGFTQMFSGQIAKGAANLFSVIKTGIAATGVGALLIAFTSLVTFFTKTEKGAEKLKVVFAGLGAAVSVIVDRIADFGGAILKFFKGDFSAAAEDMKAAFTGIGAEIKEDTALMMELQRATNALRDSERDLGIETAQRRAEIEELKMIAEDVTKTEEERLEAAQDAFDIEQDLLDKRVENAEKAVEIAQQQVDASHSSEEDLDNLAQLEINLANIRAESATKSIELNNKINSIKKEQIAKNKELLQQAQDERDIIRDINREITQSQLEELAKLRQAEIDANEDRIRDINENIKDNKRRTEALEANEKRFRNNIIQIDVDYFDRAMGEYTDFFNFEQNLNNEAKIRSKNTAQEKRKEEFEQLKQGLQDELDAMVLYADDRERLQAKLDEKLKAMQKDFNKNNKMLHMQNASNVASVAGNLFGALSALAGDNKELAIAGAIMDTYAAANGALATGKGTPLAIAQAGAIIIQGLANVKRIMEVDVGTGTGGETPSEPTRQFVSGAFDLNAQGGIVEPDPIQAYVVTDDMTNSQNKLAQIRRRATI